MSVFAGRDGYQRLFAAINKLYIFLGSVQKQLHWSRIALPFGYDHFTGAQLHSAKQKRSPWERSGLRWRRRRLCLNNS